MKAVLCLFLLFGHIHSQSDHACYLGADIALVLDISENASDSDESHVKSFGEKLLALASSHEQTLVALITYRCYAVIRFTFDDWYHEEARVKFLEVFQKLRATGNQTHRGLLMLRDQIFTSCYGARTNITKVAILVTDRPSSNIQESTRRAAALKKDGVKIHVIVIGSSVEDSEMEAYSSDPVNIIPRVELFGQLEVAFNKLKHDVFHCDPCPDGWIKSPGPDDDGFCYKLINNLQSWSTAKANCLAMNNRSRLMQFDTAQQVGWFLNEYMGRGQPKVWFGYHRDDVSQSFTGIDLSVVKWNSGYPKQDKCVYYTKYGLEDGDCEDINLSVCQLKQADIEYAEMEMEHAHAGMEMATP